MHMQYSPRENTETFLHNVPLPLSKEKFHPINSQRQYFDWSDSYRHPNSHKFGMLLVKMQN